MPEAIRVALIDDDEAVLDSLRQYFERKRVQTACFSGADAFLAPKDPLAQFDCVVADVRMPGMSGMDLVRHVAGRGVGIPVILITGHGDIDMAIGAIKLGAFDFLEKPFDEARLLDSIRRAVDLNRQKRAESADIDDLKSRADSLSERQRQVMNLAADGLSNKEIAARLNISPRTVEIHRAWMMQRMGAHNIAELVRMVMQMKAQP